MNHFPKLLSSQIGFDVAASIIKGFDRHYRVFRDAAIEAKVVFEADGWPALQKLARDRIASYDERVSECVMRLEDEYDAETIDDEVWQQIKLHFIGLLTTHRQPECAETFFNSVCCKNLHRSYFNNDLIFVRPAISTDYIENDEPAAKPNFQIHVLSSLFFRNKAAYIVGRIINGNMLMPFAIAVRHTRPGLLALDTVLLSREQLLIIFSFSHSYFLVDMEVPSAYVQFLSTLMLGKPKGEIYTSVGLQKQGKNLFYRDLLHHLKHSSDRFVIAPGIKGLVMIVFTLPSFPYVFKLIKDAFPPPKDTTRQKIQDKYLLVKRHDRMGRGRYARIFEHRAATRAA
ncbi:Isocitrate dehydrogenase phosphatase /kinase [Candidatus Burkholderia brachyanthoides]|nr:Isocitrate dehydrogenase phosphatase /kinase [Candidatus Burkholderia brachyanthoides]